ncbi:P63C domain-containing protein [Hydrogenophaga aromaticivorans]|uniref:P63C domain-containing protein n=1 Tax=Hydrogenophaga aromaticivorans TaxID=2610898 RepID=UPI001FFC486B|nr:P63C domain-containing protein [Hydrogenophaga aromaticivorans]
MTSDQRSAIARKAALKRAGIPSATHYGRVHIGGTAIPCAVLEDGRRVVVQRHVVGLLTGNQKGGLDRYFAATNIAPYVPAKFAGVSLDDAAIVFEAEGQKAHGYEGEDIVDICRMYLQARKADVLLPNQIQLAERAEIIVLSLAKLGITALIDEATGYQEVRDRRALQALLDKYLRQEHAAWAKRFPDEFYREMFRLRGWSYPTPGGSRPGVVGIYTNDLVYERLAPGLLQELESRNPKTDAGHRKTKHHQWMTADVGDPALANHIHAVMGMMRAAESWDQFMRLMDRAYPKKGQQIPLLID